MVSRRLIVVLGDQLSPDIASLKRGDPGRDIVVMGEIVEETTYVRHHKKKIAFILSAMRRFAAELGAAGWTVDYARLDGPRAFARFRDRVADALARHGAEEIIVVEPGEWRLKREIEGWAGAFGVPVAMLEDDRFLCGHAEFARWAEGRKQLRMEYFYREMRRKTGLLMDGDAPAGGQWNYDAENRKALAADLFMPTPPRFAPDATTQGVLALVAARFGDHFGDLEPFWFATSRRDAETARDHFMTQCLPRFGDYQDAMSARDRFLYHSVLSLYLNVGLLDPLDLCRRAEAAYRNGTAPLNAVEGFIRQIIGWREYVRGVYWREGPDYVLRNELGAARALPDFYWSGETDMACIAAVVSQTREEAYAHHIQRLMVTGTFALLAGIDPHDVHEWYLAVYADAFEWVEAPNVIGMSQHADGGVLASKPYAASGAYINRMSDYCAGCVYDVAKKTERDACPFNALYWDFIARHPAFAKNPRLAQIYRSFERMSDAQRRALRGRAADLLAALDAGERI